MAIIRYTQDAVLSSYQQWLMQQGVAACLERQERHQDAPDCAVQAGMVRAQAGSLLRYSVLTTLASATVFFAGQLINDAGQWQNAGETVVGTSAGGIDQVTRPATAGCYKNMVASVGSATVSGSEVYVLVELGRTNNGVFTTYAVLLSGYVRTNEPIDSGGGPATQNQTSTGGGGGCCISTLSDDVADFNPNVAYSITVPSGANGRLVQLQGGLTASANAANRRVELQLNPASGFGWVDMNTNVVTAGQSQDFGWQLDSQIVSISATGTHWRPAPANIWFSGNFTVELRAENVQTGDNFGNWDITWEIKGP